jgi:uncharacterized protein (DUF924 family)
MEKTESFRHFWFGVSEYWFGCPVEFDDFLRSKFGDLHLQIVSEDVCFEKSLEEILECILVLDQLTRHLYRNEREKWVEWDYKAIQYTKYLIEHEHIEKYTSAERCFALMPYRHTFLKDQLFL